MSDENSKARMVVGIFRHFNVPAGQSLMTGNFLAWCNQSPDHRSMTDIAEGIDRGITLGWLEEISTQGSAHQFIRVTAKGLAEG